MISNIEICNNSSGDEIVKSWILHKKSIIKVRNYLTLNTKVVFIHLRKVFIQALFFCYFNLEYYIQIENNTFDYAIGSILA